MYVVHFHELFSSTTSYRTNSESVSRFHYLVDFTSKCTPFIIITTCSTKFVNKKKKIYSSSSLLFFIICLSCSVSSWYILCHLIWCIIIITSRKPHNIDQIINQTNLTSGIMLNKINNILQPNNIKSNKNVFSCRYIIFSL